MAPFDFKCDKHFVASSDGTTLQVFELLKPSLFLLPSSIRKAHWKVVANIGTADLDHESPSHDGLLFFDGHGEIEGWAALTKLAQDLARLHLMVSPGGYCFQEVSELARDYVDFGIHYLRLNDLFSWPLHGVDLAMAAVVAWGRRSEMKYHDPRHEKPSSSRQPGVGVSKEKYEELKRTMQQKDVEMEKLRGEMDEELEKLREEKDGELEKLREELDEVKEAKDEELRKFKKEKDGELRRLLKRKDDELKMLRKGGKDVGGVVSQQLRKEKHEELRKLREEMEEEMEKLRKEKDDELEKLENEKEVETLKRLAEKDDELQKLEKEKDEELRRALKKKDEELQRLRKGKHDGSSTAEVTLIRKEKDEELQKLRREKHEELENLRREKDEQTDVTVKEHEVETLRKLSEKDEELRKLKKEKDDELEKLRDQLSSSITELTSVKQALGQHVIKTSSSSVLSPGGKVLDGLSSDKEWEFHVSRRRPVPPGTFYCVVDKTYMSYRSVSVFYLPTLTEPRLSQPFCSYRSVDEGITTTTEELLAPPQVVTETRSEGHFDVNNWWFTKTTHPEGGMTMMAYYDGDRYSINHQRWGIIRIPYPNGAHFDANRNFYMANFCGKIRFCFTYRN